MDTLSDEAKALLRRPINAWATVVRPDGSLHSTVVWVDVDGDDVLFSTVIGRAKERYLRADPRVAVNVLDPDNGFHYVNVSGTAKLDTDGADDVVNALTKKYTGLDTYPYGAPGERRVNVRVTPERVVYSSGRR